MSSAALWVVLLANLLAFLLNENNSQPLFYQKQSPIKKKENVTIHAELQTHPAPIATAKATVTKRNSNSIHLI